MIVKILTTNTFFLNKHDELFVIRGEKTIAILRITIIIIIMIKKNIVIAITQMVEYSFFYLK